MRIAAAFPAGNMLCFFLVVWWLFWLVSVLRSAHLLAAPLWDAISEKESSERAQRLGGFSSWWVVFLYRVVISWSTSFGNQGVRSVLCWIVEVSSVESGNQRAEAIVIPAVVALVFYNWLVHPCWSLILARRSGFWSMRISLCPCFLILARPWIAILVHLIRWIKEGSAVDASADDLSLVFEESRQLIERQVQVSSLRKSLVNYAPRCNLRTSSVSKSLLS